MGFAGGIAEAAAERFFVMAVANPKHRMTGVRGESKADCLS
jgi:hypothetical protein